MCVSQFRWGAYWQPKQAPHLPILNYRKYHLQANGSFIGGNY